MVILQFKADANINRLRDTAEFIKEQMRYSKEDIILVPNDVDVVFCSNDDSEFYNDDEPML